MRIVPLLTAVALGIVGATALATSAIHASRAPAPAVLDFGEATTTPEPAAANTATIVEEIAAAQRRAAAHMQERIEARTTLDLGATATRMNSAAAFAQTLRW
jgi:hypothetical protein